MLNHERDHGGLRVLRLRLVLAGQSFKVRSEKDYARPLVRVEAEQCPNSKWAASKRHGVEGDRVVCVLFDEKHWTERWTRIEDWRGQYQYATGIEQDRYITSLRRNCNDIVLAVSVEIIDRRRCGADAESGWCAKTAGTVVEYEGSCHS